MAPFAHRWPPLHNGTSASSTPVRRHLHDWCKRCEQTGRLSARKARRCPRMAIIRDDCFSLRNLFPCDWFNQPRIYVPCLCRRVSPRSRFPSVSRGRWLLRASARRRRTSRRREASGSTSSQVVRNYVAEHTPVPPMPLEELKVHADRLVEQLGCDPIYRDYIGVLLNNEMWREQLAAVPFERRLLLLPKCLRVESKCPAPFDEFGLLCKQCGLCTIQDLQSGSGAARLRGARGGRQRDRHVADPDGEDRGDRRA